MNIDEWAASVNGRYIDRDGYAGAQCHDLWLDYLHRVLGGSINNPNLGWAPSGYTDSVWKQFPAVNGVQNYVHKVGGTNIQKGDVVFWSYGSPAYPYSHVAIAMSPTSGGSVDCMTQNPGVTKRAALTLSGCIGVLRPNNQHEPPAPVDEREETEMYAMVTIGGGNAYLWNMATGETRHIDVMPEYQQFAKNLKGYNFATESEFDAFKAKYPFKLNLQVGSVTIDATAVAKAVNDDVARRMAQ